jgi:FlaG/FlaF family flagellin (archaellin)
MKRKNNIAVSPIIGTVLLLIIAVGSMSTIYLFVLSDEGPPNQRFVTVIGTVEGTDMVIEHRGGEKLPIEHITLNVMFLNGICLANPLFSFDKIEKSFSYESITR